MEYPIFWLKRVASERVASERVASERVASERVASEHVVTGRIAADSKFVATLRHVRSNGRLCPHWIGCGRSDGGRYASTDECQISLV